VAVVEAIDGTGGGHDECNDTSDGADVNNTVTRNVGDDDEYGGGGKVKRITSKMCEIARGMMPLSL
jgi:hypothetical protein